MIPRQPPRHTPLGFLYLPPFRVQGMSVAGEATVVQVPELDVCFDIGACPRPMLSSNFVALTHGHMDHSAGFVYYFSQRHFQGMGTGTILCHPHVEKPIHNIMRAWIELEAQRTPYKIVTLPADSEFKIKHNYYLRAFSTSHTVDSLGYVAIEKRSKLKQQYVGLPQEKLIELKKQGEQITQILDIPLVCYTGDTAWGHHFDRPDVLEAKILITECTFLDPADRQRAAVGKHLHLNDVVALLRRSKADAVVLTHLSRRTNMNDARRFLAAAIPESDQHRVHVLMDGWTNRQRYERQYAEAEAAEQEQANVKQTSISEEPG